MLGSIFAIISAITFAFTNASLRKGIINGTVTQAVILSMPIGVFIFFIASLSMGTVSATTSFSVNAYFWLCAAGIVHFVGGRYCNARATKAMGANLVGPVQELNLLVALVLAVVLLGEVITPLRALGIACILMGPALTFRRSARSERVLEVPLLSRVGRRPSARTRTQFQPNYVEGYIFAVLSALAFGISPVLISMAIAGAGAGVSVAGGLVSYLAATLVIAPFLLRKSAMRTMRELAPGPMRWFLVSAVSVSVSQLFRYMALSVAPVLVVAPILRLSLVFRLIFSRMMNRDHEVFGGRIVLGTTISLIGALALTVSTDAVLNLIPLPDDIVRLARWEWP